MSCRVSRFLLEQWRTRHEGVEGRPELLPELVALFLPLAAWIIASRRDDWHELLAATFVTVAIALPILVISALVEVFVTPHLLLAISS